MIITLYNDNKKLKQQVTQLKFSNSEKGREKVLRNNEHRRIKTKRKKVFEELLACYSAINGLKPSFLLDPRRKEKFSKALDDVLLKERIQ